VGNAVSTFPYVYTGREATAPLFRPHFPRHFAPRSGRLFSPLSGCDTPPGTHNYFNIMMLLSSVFTAVGFMKSTG